MSKLITLGNGAGGTAMRELIRDRFVSKFRNSALSSLMDGARLSLPSSDIVFTTDSFVVSPPVFAGGDVGKLAVCGTVNDLAVMGAAPRFLSLALIIEEGLPLERLETIVHSIADTAQSAGVDIVTGDTKVVPRGQCDQIYINTAGIGTLPFGKGLSAKSIVEGDAIIVSGTMGDHAISILAARDGLTFESPLVSDCAPVNLLLHAVMHEHESVKWMRDPTRGGLAAVLDELTGEIDHGLIIEEKSVPVAEATRAVCELLGFDPMHLANEGKVVLVVAKHDAQSIVAKLRSHPLGIHAAQIGEVAENGTSHVRVRTETGGVRRLQRPSGELLPRIC